MVTSSKTINQSQVHNIHLDKTKYIIPLLQIAIKKMIGLTLLQQSKSKCSQRDPNQAPLVLVPPLEPAGEKEEKRWKQRGSDIKSGESDNSNNIIIKAI